MNPTATPSNNMPLLTLTLLTLLTLSTSCTTAPSTPPDPTAHYQQPQPNQNQYISGYANLVKIDSGINTTPSPKILLLFGHLTYKTQTIAVPKTHQIPNTADYEQTTSSSIFNASAKTTSIRFNLTSSTPQGAQESLNKILQIPTIQPIPQEK